MKLSIHMTRREVIFGWLLMAGHLLILPVIAVLINTLLPKPLSESDLNCVVFIADFLLAILIFHKFLVSSVKQAISRPFWLLLFAIAGLILYYIGSFLVGMLISALSQDFSNVNDDTIFSLLEDNYTLMTVCTVLLVPVTEELLYRGLIFRALQKKSIVLAYAVSASAFSMIHVIGYIGSASFGTLALCFLQYIPAGFSLAWAYQKTDTICTPIAMHMTVNFISISLMRYL